MAAVTGIPDYLKKYQKDILERAKALSKRQVQLPEYQVAGMSPYQLRAMKMAQQGIGAYQPMLQAGADTLGSAAGAYKSGLGTLGDADRFFKRGARQAGRGERFLREGRGLARQGAEALERSQGRFTGQGYKQFMDPYLEEVVRAGQKDIREQGAQAMNLERGRGLGAAALGGASRANLEARKVAEQTAESATDLGSRLRSEGFRDAMTRAGSAFESQKGRQQTAGQAFGNLGVGMGQMAGQQANIGRTTMGAGTGMTGIGTGIGSLAGGLGSIGSSQAKLAGLGQQLSQSDINMLYGMGGNQQRQRQAELDALRMNQYQNYMQPYQQLGFYSDIFSGVPSSQIGFTMPQQPNPYTQIGGLMIGAGGAMGGYA